MNPVRRAGVVVATLLSAVGLLLLPAAPASAHAQVVSSNPADGQRLDASPSTLEVTVSERAELGSVVVSLVGPQGQVTGLGAPSIANPGERRPTIVIPVTTTLGTGLYRMTFTARSAVDGHTATSQIVFGVRTEVLTPAGAGGESTGDSPLDTARGLLQGLLLLGAGAAFGLVVAGGGAPRRRAVLASAGVASVAAVGVGVLWHEGNGLVVAAAGVVGAALLAIAPTRGRAALPLAAAGLVVAVAPLALVGHVAALGDLMTAVDAIHIVTTAAWVGAVAGAAYTMARMPRADWRPVLERTSRVGGLTFLAALVSGLLMSAQLVPSVGGLLGSVYGGGLVLKSLLVVPVLLLALVTRERLRRGRAGSVRIEAGLLVGVALVGIVVATQPPPVAPRFQPTPTWQADTAAAATQGDDLLVSTEIDPNSPGNRFLVVRVDSVRRPAPAPVTGVSAQWAGGAVQQLTQGNDGVWTGSVLVKDIGPTGVSVTVTRTGLPDVEIATTWTVAPLPGTYAGGPPISRYVALAIGGLVGAWLLLLVVEGLLLPRREEESADSVLAVGDASLVG